MIEGNDQPPKDDNPINDLYTTDHQPTPRKPGRIANVVGKLALVGAAIGVVGAGTRARTENDPTQPIKDAVGVSRTIRSFTIADKIATDHKPEQEHVAPIPTIEHQSSVGDEAILSEKADLTKLAQVYDSFVKDLKEIPGAIMMGISQQNKEGVKIAIGDKIYKFIWTKGEYQIEKTLIRESDDRIDTFTITDNLLTKTSRDINPNNNQTENQTTSPIDTGESLTNEIKKAHEQWTAQRDAQRENLTPPTIGPLNPTNTPEPTPTRIPNPTPTETPEPPHSAPNPLKRDIQEAVTQTAE